MDEETLTSAPGASSGQQRALKACYVVVVRGGEYDGKREMVEEVKRNVEAGSSLLAVTLNDETYYVSTSLHLSSVPIYRDENPKMYCIVRDSTRCDYNVGYRIVRRTRKITTLLRSCLGGSSTGRAGPTACAARGFIFEAQQIIKRCDLVALWGRVRKLITCTQKSLTFCSRISTTSRRC